MESQPGEAGRGPNGPNGGEVPLDELSDAIARIAPDGTLHPCNERMRTFLAGLSENAAEPTLRLDQLPFALTANDAIVLCGERAYSCRIVQRGEERWLFATERETLTAGTSAELASRRVRTLGGFAGSIVHDLANLLLAGIGVAETLKPYVRDAVDSRALADLQAGAQQGAILGRALAALLRGSPHEWELVPVRDLVDNVVVLVSKNASRSGVTVTAGDQADGVVRVLVAEATQALMHGVLFCITAGARKVVVSSHVEQAAIAAGRSRQIVTVRVIASPVTAAVAQMSGQVLTGDAGLLETMLRAPFDASGLAHARMAVTRTGGEVITAVRDETLILDYRWPERSGRATV